MEEQAQLGYQVISLDWTVDPKNARNILKEKTLQGNLDPCALYASTDMLVKHTTNMVKNFGTKRYIVNLGHGIYPDMDVNSVKTFVDTIHSFPVDK